MRKTMASNSFYLVLFVLGRENGGFKAEYLQCPTLKKREREKEWVSVYSFYSRIGSNRTHLTFNVVSNTLPGISE